MPSLALSVCNSLVHTESWWFGWWGSWLSGGRGCDLTTHGHLTAVVAGVSLQGTSCGQARNCGASLSTFVQSHVSILTDTVVFASILPLLTCSVGQSIVDTDIWFRSARLWRRSRLLSWQEWVECGGLSRRQCIGDSESCEGSRLSLDGDRLVGSRCGRGAVRHLATGGVVWIRDQGARGRQVVVGVASLTTSVVTSPSIFTHAHSGTSIIPGLSLTVGLTIHNTDVLRCWHRGVVWCGLVWVRYRCVVRYWGEGDAASDRGFGSGDQVECGDRGWGGLSALHHLTAWVCRVRDDLAVGWWDNSIQGWASVLASVSASLHVQTFTGVEAAIFPGLSSVVRDSLVQTSMSSIGSRSIVNSCWHRQNVWSRGRCGCWDLARFG